MIQQLFQSFDYLNVAQGLKQLRDREILPDFNFELASEDEKATLEWSITPIPAGGIAATRGELDPGIGFIEESLGTNSGSILFLKLAEFKPTPSMFQ